MAVKGLERWSTQAGLETLVVVREANGRFNGATNDDDKAVEIWQTRRGPVVKITARNGDGQFRSATNYVTRSTVPSGRSRQVVK